MFSTSMYLKKTSLMIDDRNCSFVELVQKFNFDGVKNHAHMRETR